MIIKRIIGNLWFWVVLAFVVIIIGRAWTIYLVRDYDFKPIPEGETLERQVPPTTP
jgi:hypothetical protein